MVLQELPLSLGERADIHDALGLDAVWPNYPNALRTHGFAATTVLVKLGCQRVGVVAKASRLTMLPRCIKKLIA